MGVSSAPPSASSEPMLAAAAELMLSPELMPPPPRPFASRDMALTSGMAGGRGYVFASAFF